MEEVEDEGDSLPWNVAHLNTSGLLELSDGSDNDGSELEGAPASELIEIDDELEEVEEPEESAEAELGQYC